jgi:hypothetical protein
VATASILFIEDRVTRKQASLQTRDKAAAQRIFNAKNESHQQPAINLQIARAYSSWRPSEEPSQPTDRITYGS